MAELENHFGVSGGETIDVGDPATKDEGVVVEAEIRSVAEDDFADFGAPLGIGIGDEADANLFGGLLYDRAEIAEALDGGETVRLENQLCLEVGDLVEGSSIDVGSANAGFRDCSGLLLCRSVFSR
jgi:hypothetical protein